MQFDSLDEAIDYLEDELTALFKQIEREKKEFKNRPNANDYGKGHVSGEYVGVKSAIQVFIEFVDKLEEQGFIKDDNES